MKHRVGVTVALSMAILLESGCALQPWFRGLLEKPEAKLDARLVDVEKTVDQHSGLESRVAGAAALAREARDRADVAVARTDTLDRRQTPAARAAREAARTRSLFGMVHVRFGLDRADLDDKAEKALVNVVKELRQNPGLTLDLEGTRIHAAHATTTCSSAGVAWRRCVATCSRAAWTPSALCSRRGQSASRRRHCRGREASRDGEADDAVLSFPSRSYGGLSSSVAAHPGGSPAQWLVLPKYTATDALRRSRILGDAGATSTAATQ